MFTHKILLVALFITLNAGGEELHPVLWSKATGVVANAAEICVTSQGRDSSTIYVTENHGKMAGSTFENLRSSAELKDGNVQSQIPLGSLVRSQKIEGKFRFVNLVSVAPASSAPTTALSQVSESGYVYRSSLSDIRKNRILLTNNKNIEELRYVGVDMRNQSLVVERNAEGKIKTQLCNGKEFIAFRLERSQFLILLSEDSLEILEGSAAVLLDKNEVDAPVTSQASIDSRTYQQTTPGPRGTTVTTPVTPLKLAKNIQQKKICMEDSGAKLRDENLKPTGTLIQDKTTVDVDTSVSPKKMAVGGVTHSFVKISAKVDGKLVEGRLSDSFFDCSKTPAVSDGPAGTDIENLVLFYSKKGVPATPLRKALVFLRDNKAKRGLRNDVMVIADFTKPSNTKRSWVIYLNKREVYASVVAHGDANGANPAVGIAKVFGNKDGSNRTPPGFHKTAGHIGKFKAKWGTGGLTLIGLEKRNSASAARGIVVHAAPKYVTELVAGRSNGCGSWPLSFARRHMKNITGGVLWYNYVAGG